MTTLHLEVPVTDFDVWKAGYGGHADARREAGVRGELVRRAVGNGSTVVVELDFDSPAAAEAFLRHLEQDVWKDNPVVAGTPRASILEPLDR